MSNNDLISRKALKEKINAFYDEHYEGFVPMELIDYAIAVDNLIDNAPTVLHDNYSMGYQDGVKKVLSERPQGEWLHPYKSDIACECSNCHRQMPIANYYHFCPNCGVKMKKEAEND